MSIFARLIIIVLFCLLHYLSIAQYDYFPAGARSMALSNASLTLNDHWGAFNNPGAVATLTNFSLGLYVERRFNIQELNSGAFTLVLPVKNAGVFNLNFLIFNNSVIYSRQKFGLIYANRLGENFFAGISLDLIRMNIDGYGHNLSVCGELGLIYKLNPKFDIGVHLFNPSSAKYNNLEDEKIPTIMRVGLGYQISENSLLVLEAGNGSRSDASFKGGLEYKVGNKFAFQIGFNSFPMTYSFGIAFLTKTLIINTALEYHQVLSYTPALAIDYIRPN